jgi:hypothetical protein
MTLLALLVVVVGGLTTIVAQLFRGHTPIDFSAYLLINGIVVVPTIVFMTALVIAFNVVLRNKYLTNVVAFGTGAALFYLYSNGYAHWLYNPPLYRFWKYSDLTSGKILGSRLYFVVLAAGFLALAHFCFERKSN